MECFIYKIGYIFTKCKESYDERLKEEKKHFKNIQNGLKESMKDIEEALDGFKNWDELMNTKEESSEENKLIRNQTIKQELKTKKRWFDLLGLIFCIFHLIGVQAGIIILNSLFSEIIDEFKLWVNKTPRIYNFYEKIEIISYRDLPEIDVGMVTSSIGIVVLKEIGFKKTNSIFQLIYAALFILLFLLFKFHTNDKLLVNYSSIEIFVLIISYIILSILVGCSSTLALKEYFELFSKVYNKKDNKESSGKDKDKDEENGSSEKIIFYALSGISSYGIMLINRLIFISFKNKTSKWLLVSLTCVCFASFFMSLIFYLLYSIPIINKIEKNKKNENMEDKKNKRKTQGIKEGGKEEKKNISNINNEEVEHKIENNNNQNNFKKDKLRRDTELIVLKKNKTYQQNNIENCEINIEDFVEKEKENDEKKDNNNKKNEVKTKICTLCGYVYVRKEKGNQKACIFYNYKSKCTWFKEKILKVDVMSAIIIEFICQLYTVGFN